MTEKLACLLLIAATVLLTGCNRDAEIEMALAEVNSFTAELVKRVESAPDRTAGVDDAQQYLDSRKREIKAQASLLARIRGIQVSDATQKKMIEAVKRDQMTVTSLQSKYMNISINDAAFKTKLDKLVSDYLDLFQA